MKVQYIHGKANKIPDFLGRIKWNKCYKQPGGNRRDNTDSLQNDVDERSTYK